MYRIGFIIVAVLAVTLGLLVGTLNSTAVHLDLLWMQLDWPLGLIVLLSFTAGILIAVVMTWISVVMPLRIRLRRAVSTTEPPQTPTQTPPQLDE
jgi:uncharacterized integral membrane protein